MTSAFADIELLGADGVTWYPLALVAAVDGNGEDVLKSFQEQLSASNADSPVADWLEPVVHQSWVGGFGIDYNEAPGIYTRTDGYAVPAGAVTQVAVPAGGTNTPIVAFAEYGGDLWAAEEGNGTTGGRVLRLTGGTGASFANSTLALGAGEILRDLCVADNGAGTVVLFASSTDTGGLTGRLHRWDGAAWTSSAVGAYGANGRNKMKRVFWTTNDGVGAWRIVVISGPGTIAYTLPNADPLQNSATSWVEGVKIATDTHIDSLAAARTHVWVSSKSNLHDLTANGDSPELLGYEDRTPDGLPFPVQYMDSHVYRAGAGTLNRIRVDGAPTLEEYPGQCAPGWGTAHESEWRGYPTAFTVDQGYLITAVWNPTTGRTGIFWGKPKESFAPGALSPAAERSPNPLIWYGPEAFSEGVQRVTAMMPSMLVSGERRLWIASLNTSSAPIIVYQSLFVAGAPVPDLISGGTHRFSPGQGGLWNPTCSLRSMPLDWSDLNSPKFVHQVSVKTRGADVASSTRLSTIGLGADRPIGTTGYTVIGSATVDPATVLDPGVSVVAGYRIDYQVEWISPSGTATPPKVALLDALRITAWRVIPSFPVLTVTVEYGDGVTSQANSEQTSISPDGVKTALHGMTAFGRTTMRLPDDSRYTVHLRQVADTETTITGPGAYGKRHTTRLQIALLSSA